MTATYRCTATLMTPAVWAIASFAFVLSAEAQTPFSRDTSVGNGADAFVRLGEATTNFGSASNVTIKDAGGSSTTRKGYIRWDVSGLSGVYSGSSLSLETSVNNPGGSGTTPQMFTVNVFGLDDGNAGENWGESTINWNNAPANASSNNIGDGAVFLGQFDVPANATPDTVSFGGAVVDAFLNRDTDGNATFILTREGGGNSANLAFSAKEAAAPSMAPTLSGNTEPGMIASITTNDGNGADAFVRQGEADTNFGSNGSVVIKGGTGSTTRKGYLRFDVSSIPQDDIVGAWLDLETSTNNSGGSDPSPSEFTVNVYGLDDASSGNDWDESTITWNNAPANQSNNNIDTSMATLLGSIEVLATDAPDSVFFSSDELLDFLAEDTDGDVTFILQRSAGGGENLAFASGENLSGAPPTLNFALAAVPEPSSIAIWALIGIGLAGFGYRRFQR